MPIKGLTDRKSIKPQLARLGKLRKGAEKTGNKPGEDLDHFRPDFNSAEIQQAFEDAYGPTPRVVNAVLFYETVEENFPTGIEAWDASGLVFRSDGEHWLIWREGDKYKRGRKPHEDHPDQDNIGRLEFLVPELIQQGFIGTVTLETHSINDLLHISGALLAAEQERGTLRGAQFVLRRVEEEISVPGWGDRKGKRSRAKKWLVKLELPRQIFSEMLSPGGHPALEAGDVDVTTGEIVEEIPAPAPKAKPKKSTQTQIGRPKAEKARFTRAAIEARWEELWSEARALELDTDALPKTTPQMTNEELIEAGKALAAIVKNAKASAAE